MYDAHPKYLSELVLPGKIDGVGGQETSAPPRS
eukprot:gene26772-biopygen17326